MNRTVLAIIKAGSRELVTIEVCDTPEELAEAHAGIKSGYACEVFELGEPARRFLLDWPATYDAACPACGETVTISQNHLFPSGTGTGIPLDHEATLGDLIDAASAHECDEGDDQADG